MEPNELEQLSVVSREHFHFIWNAINSGDELEGEDKVIGELMQQHPEFYDDWNSTDFGYKYDPESEVNPFLHISLDAIVVNQLNNNDPKQTRITYNKLRREGDSHLDAVHKIAAVLVDEIWNIMRCGREFDERRYVRKLKRLTK